ncbi:DNA (cytosine-5-)-methyltransferase, partial [Dysosmobacter welbionis]
VLAIRLVIGGGEAGGQQHHQAHAGQQHHQDEEGQVNGPLGQFPALLLQL